MKNNNKKDNIGLNFHIKNEDNLGYFKKEDNERLVQLNNKYQLHYNLNNEDIIKELKDSVKFKDFVEYLKKMDDEIFDENNNLNYGHVIQKSSKDDDSYMYIDLSKEIRMKESDYKKMIKNNNQKEMSFNEYEDLKRRSECIDFMEYMMR